MKKPECLDRDCSLSQHPSGYILPCCYTRVNDGSDPKHGLISSLYKERLKIDNVDSIEEIIFSDEWINFFDVIENKEDEWPDICLKVCDNGH